MGLLYLYYNHNRGVDMRYILSKIVDHNYPKWLPSQVTITYVAVINIWLQVVGRLETSQMLQVHATHTKNC
jgi:hypothetical protein